MCVYIYFYAQECRKKQRHIKEEQGNKTKSTLQMKGRISEMKNTKKKRKKNTISRVNNRLETKEGKISKLEDLATEVIYYETQT